MLVNTFRGRDSGISKWWEVPDNAGPLMYFARQTAGGGQQHQIICTQEACALCVVEGCQVLQTLLMQSIDVYVEKGWTQVSLSLTLSLPLPHHLCPSAFSLSLSVCLAFSLSLSPQVQWLSIQWGEGQTEKPICPVSQSQGQRS